LTAIHSRAGRISKEKLPGGELKSAQKFDFRQLDDLFGELGLEGWARGPIKFVVVWDRRVEEGVVASPVVSDHHGVVKLDDLGGVSADFVDAENDDAESGVWVARYDAAPLSFGVSKQSFKVGPNRVKALGLER
jgi:hypothetical protein